MKSTGPILAVGAVTLTRQVIVDEEPIDWRIPVATGVAAVAFAGFEKLTGPFAVGVAWLALFTVTFVRVDPARPAPVEALMKKWNEGG